MAYAGVAWYRYGQAPRSDDEQGDELLDRFIPEYEVVERHQIRVNAPAAVVFAAASEQNLQQSAIVRAIFKARELALGATPDELTRPQGLVALCRSLGWGVLAEIPGREIVMGAVTQPWKANVVFRAIAPDRFATFDEPDYVKIVWTLRPIQRAMGNRYSARKPVWPPPMPPRGRNSAAIGRSPRRASR